MSEIIPFANTIWNTSKLNDKFIFDYNNVSIENFDEGLNYFLETGIINSYRVSLQKNGKEFISDLALKIIEDNSICQNYIYSKYDSIYNDEAQDYNESQINFLAFLYNKLKITLILVGDISQSIYGWRGAMPEYFKKFISETNLKCLSLSKNFRCHKSIQNYANKFKFLPIKSFKTTESRIRLVNFGLEDSFNWIKYVEKITLDYSSLTIIVYSFKVNAWNSKRLC